MTQILKQKIFRLISQASKGWNGIFHVDLANLTVGMGHVVDVTHHPSSMTGPLIGW